MQEENVQRDYFKIIVGIIIAIVVITVITIFLNGQIAIMNGP